MKKSKRKWCYAAILLAGLGFAAVFSADGNTQAQGLSEAQKEKAGLEQELEEAQKMIDSLNDSKDDIEENVKELEMKLQNISRQISKLENQLTEKQKSVDTTRQELSVAEEDRQKQYEDMKLRIQFLYESQTTTMLEKLFTSGSLGELLNNAEYIAEISQYDRNMLLQYEKTVESIAKMEETLKTELKELQAMKEKVETEQKAVAALVQEKEAKLAQTEGELIDVQKVAEVYEAEIQAQNEIIAQIQAAEAERKAQEQARKEAEAQAKKEAEEQARKEAEAQAQENQQGQQGEQGQENQQGQQGEQGQENQQGQQNQENVPTEENKPDSEESPGEGNGDNTDNSGEGNSGKEEPVVSAFTWPCPSSRRITSDYGPRESPTAGASSYHRGIDVGAAHGADIVAAADGSVVFAGYSNSAGNYVTVSHGNGLYTVYMHCSSLVVSQGQRVSRGQVIAKVGSTGISTGNHLHFGVSLNGSYVNPWNYL